MATLVLTAVGTAVGGPIGAALGGLVGGALDRALLAPGGREGPRLAELKVQTSSYGAPLPLVFGSLRVAGTVIWATDLTEHRDRQGGGKGQPGTTRYTYSASFAVALSGRRVRRIGRIWAEGKLLRGAAGDWKTELGGFRLHDGGEDQMPDPLIAAREGAGLAPAHRGVAYAVFEDLALADFGNRIPSLTFEVIADEGPVTVGAVLAAASGGLIAVGGTALMLAGYAAHGPAGALAEQLADAAGAALVPAGARLRLAGASAAVAELADAGVAAGLRGGATGQRRIGGAEAVPERVVVAHYDPARDWQTGSQSVGRATGGRERRVELPAALSAGEAKTLAAAMLARAGAERVRRTILPGWAALAVRPGDVVRIAGEAGDWRVRSWALEKMAPAMELTPVTGAPVPLPAAPGRIVGGEDRVLGATVLAAFEVPGWPDEALVRPRLLVAAAGTAPGWRRAALLLSTDGGTSWREAGGTAAPAVIGTVVVPAGAGDPALVDRHGAIEVMLLHDEMELASASAARVDAGANLALVGNELVQFESAEPLGGARWRLTGLWRGRRATSLVAGAAGDRFVLLDPATLAVIDLEPHGGAARVLASGPGDVVPTEAEAVVTGAALVPPPPVFLRAVPEAGGVRLRWTRRSRTGWRWQDGADVPLGEEREAYRVTVDGADHLTDAPTLWLPTGGFTATVRQIGTWGESAPSAVMVGEDA